MDTDYFSSMFGDILKNPTKGMSSDEVIKKVRDPNDNMHWNWSNGVKPCTCFKGKDHV